MPFDPTQEVEPLAVQVKRERQHHAKCLCCGAVCVTAADELFCVTATGLVHDAGSPLCIACAVGEVTAIHLVTEVAPAPVARATTGFKDVVASLAALIAAGVVGAIVSALQ